jgi:hypothetical protein
MLALHYIARAQAMRSLATAVLSAFVWWRSNRTGPASRRAVSLGSRCRGLFHRLRDGASVPAKLKINLGLRNMNIAPAGSARENSGHHHLLIDADLPPLDEPIPNTTAIACIRSRTDRSRDNAGRAHPQAADGE